MNKKAIPLLIVSTALLTGCFFKKSSSSASNSSNSSSDSSVVSESSTQQSSSSQTPVGDPTIDFREETQRVSQNASSQVWKSGVFTFTNNKGSSKTDVSANFNPVRCYKDSNIVLSVEGGTISSVSFATGGDYYGKNYDFNGSETVSAGTLSRNGDSATLTGVNAASVTITLNQQQVRFFEIKVTLA